MKHYGYYPARRKSTGIAFILWLFLGVLGAHRFYLRDYGMGVFYFFTGGGFMIGWLIDLFRISKMVDIYNYRYAQEPLHHTGGYGNTYNHTKNYNNTIIINNVMRDVTKVETKDE